MPTKTKKRVIRKKLPDWNQKRKLTKRNVFPMKRKLSSEEIHKLLVQTKSNAVNGIKFNKTRRTFTQTITKKDATKEKTWSMKGIRQEFALIQPKIIKVNGKKISIKKLYTEKYDENGNQKFNLTAIHYFNPVEKSMFVKIPYKKQLSKDEMTTWEITEKKGFEKISKPSYFEIKNNNLSIRWNINGKIYSLELITGKTKFVLSFDGQGNIVLERKVQGKTRKIIEEL